MPIYQIRNIASWARYDAKQKKVTNHDAVNQIDLHSVLDLQHAQVVDSIYYGEYLLVRRARKVKC